MTPPIQVPTENPKPSRQSGDASGTQSQSKKALPSLDRKTSQLSSTSKSIQVWLFFEMNNQMQSVNSFFGDSDAEPVTKVPRLETNRSFPSEKSAKPSITPSSKKVTPVQVEIPQDVILESIPPRGRENCLDGYKIAFTGGMGEYMSRTDLEELVLQYGGKVAQNVSGKTTLLVASPKLEDGRDSTTSSKYRSALEKNVFGILLSILTIPRFK
jgi:NAD-dependent DNA ligase